MPLPKIEVPKYELTIPSSGELVKYRPFLVREEKILLLAMESEDDGQMIDAVQDIIKNCLYDEVDVSNMPMFDIEFVFLQLRAKSKGEEIDLSFECEKCKTSIPIKINLNDVKVQRQEGNEKKISLTDDVGIILKYPSINLQKIIEGNTEMGEVETVFKTIISCVESIWDKETVYSSKDHTPEELTDFIESLPDNSFTKLQKFFDTMPVLKHDVKIKCNARVGKGKNKTSCGWSETKTLEGMGSFFA
jgi:hypothetical protein